MRTYKQAIVQYKRRRRPLPAAGALLLALLMGLLPVQVRISPAAGVELAVPVAQAAGVVSGNVFRDYNANGVDNGVNEPGVGGVVVTLYDAASASCQTTSDAAGNYSIDTSACGVGPGPYRVEFSLPADGSLDFLQPGVAGGTTVQFVPDGGGTVNVPFHNPAQYSQPNPLVALPFYRSGRGTGSTASGLVSFNYNTQGIPVANPPPDNTAPNPIQSADVGEVGTVWGMAWQPASRHLYTASFLKRHAGFADGPGYLYLLNYSGGPANTPIAKMDLQGIAPANGGPAIDLGWVCRNNINDGAPANCITNAGTAPSPGTGNVNDYQLPTDPTVAHVDLDAFGKVGRISFGDIDVTEDANTLWLVNLNQRALISMDVSAVDAANFAGTVGAINQYLLDNLPGLPTCTNGVFRPWALNFHDGLGYLGGVCSGENESLPHPRSRDTITAHVLTFDPTNLIAGFSEVLNFDLDYVREPEAFDSQVPYVAPGDWQPWALDWAHTQKLSPPQNNFHSYPQPILADLDFADDGSMILGFMDRLGHQIGPVNYTAQPGSTTTTSISTNGDIVKACLVSGGFVLEGQPGCPVADVPQFLNERGDDGPSNSGEFFRDDKFVVVRPNTTQAGHLETAQGALAWLPGSGEIMSVSGDPLRFGSGGVRRYNTATGTLVAGYEIYQGALANGGLFHKGNGLGDIELLSAVAPIEIGNYVWYDTDRDGIQGPDEPPLAGVVVELLAPDGQTVLATATTDANGQYIFSSDPTRAAETTASRRYNIAGLTTNTAGFQVRINLSQPVLSTYLPTLPNSQGDTSNHNVLDLRDSDGVAGGGYVATTFATGGAGANNHTLDFGFYTLAVDIEKLTNGNQADLPNDLDVPQIAPGQPVTWTYIVRNDGTSPILRSEITVTDNVVGDLMVAGLLQTPGGEYGGASFGSVDQLTDDDVLAPGEVFHLLVTWTAPDLSVGFPDPDASQTDPWVVGCGDGNPQTPDERITYENRATVTIPTDSDSDDSHFCNPPSIEIEKLTNGNQADLPNDADVPVIPPGDLVTWTYIVTNDGTVSIPRSDIDVTDNVVGNLMVAGVLQTPGGEYGGVTFGSVDQLTDDDFLAPGEVFHLLVTWAAPDMGAIDPAASATDQWVVGCGAGSQNPADLRTAYENRATVTIPTDTDSDDSHFCNPPPSIDIEKLTNGNQADLPNDADVPVIPPGDLVTWTYIVTNDGPVSIPRGDIDVTDNVAGNLLVGGVLQTLAAPYGGVTFGNVNQLTDDDVLAPGEVFHLLVTWAAPDMGAIDPAASATDQWVMGCGAGSQNPADLRTAYENRATVTIPQDTDQDDSHFCNPPPAIDIEKLTNGHQADGANDTDVPVLTPGDDVTWSYIVTNDGTVSIPRSDINVTDDIIGNLLVNGVLQAGVTLVYYGNGDDILSPGEFWILTVTGTVPDLNDPSQTVGLTIVPGCDPLDDGIDARRNTYANVATVAIPTDSDQDPSHFCNPKPGIAIEKLTNGADADDPNGGDVPILTPSARVTWSYIVRNAGTFAIPRSDITVSDDLEGNLMVNGVLQGNTTLASYGNGNDLLEPNEFWMLQLTRLVPDLSDPSQTVGLTIVPGCDPLDDGIDTRRNTYFNIATVTIPNDRDDDPSSFCNPPPHIDIEKLTNGNQADGANDLDVPVLTPGDPVVWTYIVRNTGAVAIPLSDIDVRDDRVGSLMRNGILQTLPAPYSGARFGDNSQISDGSLGAGEHFTLLVETTAPDLNDPSQTAGLTIVPGCDPLNDAIETRRATYRNIATVTIPGARDDDPSHFCNPKPGIDIEKLTNGADADDPNGTDVPHVPPGAAVTWTYILRNIAAVTIGQQDITIQRGDLNVSDDVQGPVILNGVLQAGATFIDQGDGDDLLAPGEEWRIQMVGSAPELNAPATNPALTIVPGCNPTGTSLDTTRATYRNIATVTIPGGGDSDPSHFCHPPQGIENPKAIELVSFTAVYQEGQVVIEWQTEAELETWGYHLLRSAGDSRASAVRITETLIATQGSQGGRYQYHDPTGPAGASYSYWLVEVLLDGSEQEYGPVTVRTGSFSVFLPQIQR